MPVGVTQVKFGHCSRVVTVAQLLLLLVEVLLVGSEVRSEMCEGWSYYCCPSFCSLKLKKWN